MKTRYPTMRIAKIIAPVVGVLLFAAPAFAQTADDYGIAAAGTYFLYGRRGSKNRERIAGWTLQLKGEVLEQMEMLKDINQQAYNELVDETAKRYGRVKRVSSDELAHITDEIKSAWTHIGKQLK